MIVFIIGLGPRGITGSTLPQGKTESEKGALKEHCIVQQLVFHVSVGVSAAGFLQASQVSECLPWMNLDLQTGVGRRGLR